MSTPKCRICLVASCPGGVASNVVTFLARADVPLSVAMTTVSTLSAIVATPALTQLLVGHLVPVNAGSLLLSTLQVTKQLPALTISLANESTVESTHFTHAKNSSMPLFCA